MTARVIPIRAARAAAARDRRQIASLCTMLDNDSDLIELMVDTLESFLAPDALVYVRELIRVNRVTVAALRDSTA